MTSAIRFALIGDYNQDVTAHVAIPKALAIAAANSGQDMSCEWIATSKLPGCAAETLRDYDAVWCVPASPYESMEGALEAIRYSRENHIPFLGTCGGYQHAVLEFARTVLGLAEADNSEVNPEAAMPLIAPLACALVEESAAIDLTPGSRVANLYGADRVEEKYRCSYGVAPEYLGLFDNSALTFTGFDEAADPRAFELKDHPFFLGTAYQPERSALLGQSHPVIEGFVRSAAGQLSLVA